jgi:hypothetical protein
MRGSVLISTLSETRTRSCHASGPELLAPVRQNLLGCGLVDMDSELHV